ncbi:MAG: zinc-ribbon domain containing protein [Chloroflexota bacterium]|nr:zinc-ribbon domain containing protein [Chloroflexota bacterium]
MSFTDKELQCIQCGNMFTFGAGEQEFFATKGFTNEPKRCPNCRASRKMERGGGFSGSHRQMYSAVCSACGVDTEVPFEPRLDKPVYCSQCYNAVGSTNRR